LSTFFTEFNALLEKNEWDCLSQQEGVTAHIVKTTTAFLQEFFDDHMQGLFDDHMVRHDLWLL
jgi:hypothetical protein